MSDHVQEIVQQIVAVAGNPLESLESVGGQLRQLYDQAEQAGDGMAMQVVSQVWGEVQAMNQQTGAAVDLAAAAKKVAEEITGQRDALAEQHGKLVKDLNDVNVDNPLVDKVWDAATESYEEDLMYSDTFVSSDPGDDIVNSINGIPVTVTEARYFFDMLMGGFELDDIHREKLADFIQHFVKEVLESEREHEMDVDDIDGAA